MTERMSRDVKTDRAVDEGWQKIIAYCLNT